MEDFSSHVPGLRQLTKKGISETHDNQGRFSITNILKQLSQNFNSLTLEREKSHLLDPPLSKSIGLYSLSILVHEYYSPDGLLAVGSSSSAQQVLNNMQRFGCMFLVSLLSCATHVAHATSFLDVASDPALKEAVQDFRFGGKSVGNSFHNGAKVSRDFSQVADIAKKNLLENLEKAPLLLRIAHSLETEALPQLARQKMPDWEAWMGPFETDAELLREQVGAPWQFREKVCHRTERGGFSLQEVEEFLRSSLSDYEDFRYSPMVIGPRPEAKPFHEEREAVLTEVRGGATAWAGAVGEDVENARFGINLSVPYGETPHLTIAIWAAAGEEHKGGHYLFRLGKKLEDELWTERNNGRGEERPRGGEMNNGRGEVGTSGGRNDRVSWLFGWLRCIRDV